MQTRRIWVVVSGVTGPKCTHHHVARSIVAILRQGDIRVSLKLTRLPDPMLVGRHAGELHSRADTHGVAAASTDLENVLSDRRCEVFFDASTTLLRKPLVGRAVTAGRATYHEKPTAASFTDALSLAATVGAAGLKSGVVADRFLLPGIRKLRHLLRTGFFGRLLSVRGEFGYWVFTGLDPDQPVQRPN